MLERAWFWVDIQWSTHTPARFCEEVAERISGGYFGETTREKLLASAGFPPGRQNPADPIGRAALMVYVDICPLCKLTLLRRWRNEGQLVTGTRPNDKRGKMEVWAVCMHHEVRNEA